MAALPLTSVVSALLSCCQNWLRQTQKFELCKPSAQTSYSMQQHRLELMCIILLKLDAQTQVDVLPTYDMFKPRPMWGLKYVQTLQIVLLQRQEKRDLECQGPRQTMQR